MRLKYKRVCSLLLGSLLALQLFGCGRFLPETEEKVTEAETQAVQPAETEESTEAEPSVILPERYDYREEGRCPDVGSQGDLGTCWAFATMIALESALLPEESCDFSEDHISMQNSFGMEQNMGGDYTMAMAYLLGWQGPVWEAEDPYGDGTSPEGLRPVKHIQEIRLLEEKDYEAIKKAVYSLGGVQTSLYTAMADMESSEYYNKEMFAYYYGGEHISNHDVVIIGWDDTFPREAFSSDPGQDGAFLCMNSWGEEFGDSGVFYVSYADSNIGLHSLVYTGIEEPDNYDGIYQTDRCGWLGQLGYGDEEAYFANVYHTAEDESLEAVGFYATGPDTSYEVYVVHEASEDGGLKLLEPAAAGKFSDAGFYTISLDEAEALYAGERFAVAVKIHTPDAVHPVAIEYQSGEDEIYAQVNLKDGEGYISADGRNWMNTETEQSSNVCLKAYVYSRE